MIHVIVYLIIYYYFFRGDEFRQEYGQLAHLRSIVPDNTTFVALTATATKSMKTEICKKLDILECESTTVWLSPERTNITYLLSKSKKSVYELQWLFDDLLKNRESATKTIVYCRNIASCSTLYEHFSLHLPQSEILSERLIAMFHRSTAQLNKAHVLKEFPKNDSVLRILFASCIWNGCRHPRC